MARVGLHQRFDHRGKVTFGRTLNEPIASRSKIIGALRSNAVPSPFKHLDDNNWSPGAGEHLCRDVQLHSNWLSLPLFAG
jgi:hypothetical protein